jgi:hypothetical protein
MQAKYVRVKLAHNQSNKQQTNQPQIASSIKPSLHGLLMLQTWQKGTHYKAKEETVTKEENKEKKETIAIAKHKRLNLSQTLNLQYAKEQKLTNLKDVPTFENLNLYYCLKLCLLCRCILTFKNNVNILPIVSRSFQSILTHTKQLRRIEIKE